jgi:hypothetical protein
MAQMASAPLIEDGRVCYFAFVDCTTLGYGNVTPQGAWTSRKRALGHRRGNQCRKRWRSRSQSSNDDRDMLFCGSDLCYSHYGQSSDGNLPAATAVDSPEKARAFALGREAGRQGALCATRGRQRNVVKPVLRRCGHSVRAWRNQRLTRSQVTLSGYSLTKYQVYYR